MDMSAILGGEGNEEHQSQRSSEGGQTRLGRVEFARRLRREQTPQERELWTRLRDRRLGGYKFRRQHPIEPYTVDFYCAECRLVIELDGGGHADQQDYDQARTRYLERNGYRVIRFSNRQVNREMPAVLEAILAACEGESQ